MARYDSGFVITPNGDTPTPVEAAVAAYQLGRDKNPLPSDWTEFVEMVPARHTPDEICLDAYNGEGELNLVFVVHLRHAEYVLELVFRPFVLEDVVTKAERTVGGFQFEFCRTDGAVPTATEISYVITYLLGNEFSLLKNGSSLTLLDGCIDDLPLPTQQVEVLDGGALRRHGRSFAMVLREGVAEQFPDLTSFHDLSHHKLPCLEKGNTRKYLMADVLGRLAGLLRESYAARTWVKLQIALLSDGTPAARRDQRARAQFIEARHGLRHVKSLAGMYRDRRGVELTWEEELGLAVSHLEGRIDSLLRLRRQLDAINR